MRLRSPIAWLAIASLTACQVTVSAPPARKTAPAAVHAPSASGVPAASQVVTATASRSSPAASAKPAAPSLLVPAAAGATAIAGRVSVDPTYLLATKAGVSSAPDGGILVGGAQSVVAHDGGTVISNDASTVISHDGSTLVDASGRIVAQGGGNVIVPAELIGNDGSGLISQDGGGLISQDGGGIVAQGGGNIVAQGGGNIVAQGGGNAIARSYGLLADATGTPAGPTGSPSASGLVPAAGMAVYVRSLENGQPIPIGMDAARNRVYAVYTNAKGEYKLFLPSTVTKNVEVAALALNARDSRLRYTRLAQAQGAVSLSVDDDTAASTTCIRLAVARFLTQLLLASDPTKLLEEAASPDDSDGLNATSSPPPLPDATQPILTALKQSKANQIQDPKERARFALEMADAFLADLKLGDVELDPTLPPDIVAFPLDLAHAQALIKQQGTTNCLALLNYILEDRRASVARRLARVSQSPEAFFGALDVVKQADQRDQTQYLLERPMDFNVFVAVALVGGQNLNPRTVGLQIQDLVSEAGLDFLPGGHDVFQAIFSTILDYVGTEFLYDPAVQAELIKRFNAYPSKVT